MTREEVQVEAVEAFIKNGCKGILKIKTGIGKTRIAAMVIKKMLELNIISLLDTVSFYAEISMDKNSKRRADFLKEWELISGQNINFEFYTYQSLTKPTSKFIILDEIDYIGQEMIKPFIDYKGFVLGLTATISKNNNDGEISKASLLKKIAPVIYEYGFNQALEHNNTNAVHLYMLRHKLDDTTKNIQITKNWKGTEKEFWDYWIKVSNEQLENNTQWALSIRKYKLPKFLYSLPSKVNVAREFLDSVSNPTLGFALEIDFLKKISLYTIEDHTLDSYIDMFTKKQIKFLLSAKKLQRGYNLPEVKNIFLIGMGKNSDILEQIIGRSRLSKDKITNVVMIVTEGTYEEKWFNEITKKRQGKKIVETLLYEFKGYVK